MVAGRWHRAGGGCCVKDQDKPEHPKGIQWFLTLRSTRKVTDVVTDVVEGCSTARKLLLSGDTGENMESFLEC